MSGYRKVLIAVNGSRDVLVEGLKVLASEKCSVTVVKITPPYEGDLSLVGVTDIEHALAGFSEKEISEIRDIAKSKDISVKVRIEEGEISRKIVDVAEEENADLIIMGAGSRNSIKRLFFGSLVDDVRREATCPVLAVNAETAVDNLHYLRAYSASREQKQVVAALKPRFY